jgi:fructan beta-fructosidase
MNDPNGLVYVDGVYHLFYQYHPFSTIWGPMHWGHAISPDLLHWENLPIALYPDEIGTIFSGSAVVDTHNTAGFGAGVVIALFSYNTQKQGIAYSLDKGMTWTKYAHNPIIDALAHDFRDPKVFWYAPDNRWVMCLAVGKEIQFFGSDNLRQWHFMDRFYVPIDSGVWECPDLFALRVGDQEKWVLLVSVGDGAPAGGSGTLYFVGHFDGQHFMPDDAHERLWLDYGSDNYAGVTWSNTPDGRRLLMGWMSNWRYARTTPTSTWRGAMTIPRELSLVNTPHGIRLAQTPIALQTLHDSEAYDATPHTLTGRETLPIRERKLEIQAEFSIQTAHIFGVMVHDNGHEAVVITVDVAQHQLHVTRPQLALEHYMTHTSAPLLVENERVTLHILLDESSIEVFAQDGTSVITMQTFGDLSADGITLFCDTDSVKIKHLSVKKLKSVWGG